MKLLLFSDLHLDTPFRWASVDLAQRRRQAIRDTLVRTIDLAIDERVDAVLCGGDLYEHERFTADTGSFLQNVFRRLHPVPIYIAPGNHDWCGPASLYKQIHWSDNVHIFMQDRLQPVELDKGITLWGAAHLKPAGTTGFCEGFSANRTGVNIAIFHGSELNWLAFEESGKQPHAPFRYHDIPKSGLNHAFLGHYHQPKDNEYFTYPGNPEPLSFGEDGPRGVVLIEVLNNGSIKRERKNVAGTTIVDDAVGISDCGSLQDVRDLIAARLRGHNGVARITIKGDLDPRIDLRTGSLEGVAAWMDCVVYRTNEIHVKYDFEALAKEQTVRGEFVREVNGQALSDEVRYHVLVTGLRALEGRDDLDVF